MPGRPEDTSLLKAVELLMGQFSEQILALLEAHARGDLADDAFEARIRDLVGAVSPAAVARHPGRLALARPTPPVPPCASEPAAPVPDLPPAPEPPVIESEPPTIAPEPVTAALEPPPLVPAGPVIPDGVGGYEPLPEFELEEFSGEPVAPVVLEPEEALPAAASDLPGPAAAAPPLASVPPAILDGVTGFEPLPGLDADLPLGEPLAPSSVLDLPPASEPAPEPESPAILDGVSGFESLSEFELEEFFGEPVAPVAPKPEGALPASASDLPEPADELPPPASAGPAILDGASGFEPLPEFELEVFSEAPAAPAPAAEPPRSTPAGEGPAAPLPPPPAPPRPGKVPARNTAPATSPAPGSRPSAPVPPAAPAPAAPDRAKVPAPAPGEAKARPAPLAGPSSPAAAPGKPPRPAAPSGPPRMSGRSGVVISGRMGGDDLAPAGRPAMGFGEGMFGDKNGGAPAVSRETSFVSRQVRRELREKGTWRSPGKAALLSLLLPGVGDFYLGKVSTGLVFYLVFYLLLVLCILRGDLMLVPVLVALALASCLTSWLGAHKHNDIIHRMQDTPGLGRKTRETNFSFDHSRRRR